MTLGRRAHAADALRRDHDSRGITRRHIIHDLIEIENCIRWRACVPIGVRRVSIDTHPFVGFARIIQAQIVVDGLWREHRGQPLRERLQTVQRAVTTDRDESINSESLQAFCDPVQFGSLLGIDVVPCRTYECAALGGIEFRDALKQRIQMNVR